VNHREIFERARQEFWTIRQAQADRQALSGRKDAGTRGTVTGGGHLDDFAHAIQHIFEAEGIRREFVRVGRRLTIPGYFRPTKDWDVVVCNGHEVGALIELKSQVGSLGNNFNNRAEEAIGNAKDVRVAFTNELLGTEVPFLAFLMVIEDSDDVVRSRRTSSKFFTVDPELRDTPFAIRWQRLLSRLVREQLYDTACLLPTTRDTIERVAVDSEVSLDRFLASLVARAQYLSMRPGWTNDVSQLSFR
jgi:Restriction endonuclease XhoI